MGCGGSSDQAAKDAQVAKDAPYLHEYFTALAKKTDEQTHMELGMALMMGDSSGIEKMEKEMQEWFANTGKPMLTKSFQHHDKDNSKALDKEEAKVFFFNLIREQVSFRLVVARNAAHFTLKANKAMVNEKTKEIKKEAKAEVEKGLAAQKKDLDARIVNYKRNKDEYDEKGFHVMDMNDDGKITLDEFLDTFSPAGDRLTDLLLAIGFLTAEEKVQAEQLKKLVKGGGMAEIMKAPDGPEEETKASM